MSDERRKNLLVALREALADDPLPAVIKTVADGFEGAGIRIAIAAIKTGDPNPLIENRIEQTDAIGFGLSQLGQRFGAMFTKLAQPRTRRPPRRG